MKESLNNADRVAIFRIVAIYTFFSVLWIYLSDEAIAILIHDPAILLHFSLFKGFLFIALTSYLLTHLIASDIRTYRNTERDLRESEERYRQLFENAPDAIFVHDGSKFTFANEAARHLFGAVSPEQLLGKSVLERVCPDVREMVKERARLLLESRTVIPLSELCLIRLDGTAIEVEIVGASITSQGNPAILIIARDITVKKRMESELRETAKRLNKAQEIAHVGSWELDVVNNVLTWSDEVYRIFGLKPEEFGATYEAFMESVHPDDRLAVDAAYSGSLQEGRNTFEIEHRVVRKQSGKIRYVHEKCEHIRDETGRIIHSIGMAHDITERKQAEEALQKLNEELEIRVAERTKELEQSRTELKVQNLELQSAYEKLKLETAERLKMVEELRRKDQLMIQQSRMAAMGEMLGNIAHQWRQPLNVVGLKIQAIGLSYELGGFNKDLLDDSIAKAMDILQHMSQTIDDFRDITAPDKEKTVFKVDEVIARMLFLIEETFRERGIAIEISTRSDPQVNGYPNEFIQVLLNILMNAKDAFLERRIENARLTVRSWVENGKAVVTVTDNAGGIEEPILNKIFDAYFTTKGLGKGTGVGLFMAKTIIEKNMGGRLAVRNTNGGAEFRIEV